MRLSPILLKRPIGDLDRILHAKTEAKMAGKNKAHRAKVKHRGQEVLLARVLLLTVLFHPGNDGAFIEVRDMKLPSHAKP